MIPAPTNHRNIETTLRESMLYEAGVLAGEARGRYEAAEQLLKLAAEVQQKDPKAFADSLLNIAALLNETADGMKKSQRARAVSAAAGLPLSAASLTGLVAGVVDLLTKSAGALSLGASKSQDDFVRQLAAIGELPPAEAPQVRPRPRSRLARLLIGLGELREATRVDSAK